MPGPQVMASLDEAVRHPSVVCCLEQWSSDPAPPARIEAGLVHKSDPRNVLVARIQPLSGELAGLLCGEIHRDLGHPFFFEHPLDHIPGLYLLEAGRQFAEASVTIQGQAALSERFIARGFTAQFSRFAEKDRPVFVLGRLEFDHAGRGPLKPFTMPQVVVQGGTIIGTMTGTFLGMTAAAYSMFRK